jgi:thioester reductase-like protein
MKGRIKVLRIGQLTGDTTNGVWNMTEAWPMMLSTVEAVGCLPKRDDKLSWLPLDIAAQAAVEISLGQSEGQNHDETCQVFHIVNNFAKTSWEDLLSWIREVRSKSFDIVEPSVWAGKVGNLESHPAKNLLWLWAGDRTKRKESEGRSGPFFDVANAERRSEAMRSVKPVDKELVQKIWRWIECEVQ